MIILGSRVRDRVSGFKGIAMGRTEYLLGCARISVAPEELHDGATIAWHTFDEPQLEVLPEEGLSQLALESKGNPGGPRPDPPSRVTKD